MRLIQNRNSNCNWERCDHLVFYQWIWPFSFCWMNWSQRKRTYGSINKNKTETKHSRLPSVDTFHFDLVGRQFFFFDIVFLCLIEFINKGCRLFAAGCEWVKTDDDANEVRNGWSIRFLWNNHAMSELCIDSRKLRMSL